MTWYAFTCCPQLERRAWDGLEKIHVEPARMEIPRFYRSRDGRRRIIMRPLIPGYAIANVQGPIPWSLIRMIEWRGVPVIYDVLRFDSVPVAIPAEEVKRLAVYLAGDRPHDGPGTLRPGAKRRVGVGLLDDQPAVIKRVLSAARCTGMMYWFGAEREVQISRERLREAG